jgi:hypothetical protein
MKKFSLDEWRAYLPAQAKAYRVEIKEKRPAITISRETGAGAITIGQMVTDSFQSLEKGAPRSWALFDQNIVKAVIEDQAAAKPVLKTLCNPDKYRESCRLLVQSPLRTDMLENAQKRITSDKYLTSASSKSYGSHPKRAMPPCLSIAPPPLFPRLPCRLARPCQPKACFRWPPARSVEWSVTLLNVHVDIAGHGTEAHIEKNS